MTLIQDGLGRGHRAGVTSEGRLLTMAVETSVEHHVNHHEGDAYNLLFTQAPTAADDCIIYMENTHTTKDAIVEGIILAVSAACKIDLYLGAVGTRNGASDIVPANLNAGSNKSAIGNFEQGADLDGGSATLNGTKVKVFSYKFIAAAGSTSFNFDQDLIIPPNKTLTIWCDTLGIVVDGMIPFNYHNFDLDN